MMETMIPPQVGMRLRTLWKIKEAKEAQIKKEAKEAHQKEKKEKKTTKEKREKIKKWEKKREGAMLLSFYHTCASE